LKGLFLMFHPVVHDTVRSKCVSINPRESSLLSWH